MSCRILDPRRRGGRAIAIDTGMLVVNLGIVCAYVDQPCSFTLGGQRTVRTGTVSEHVAVRSSKAYFSYYSNIILYIYFHFMAHREICVHPRKRRIHIQWVTSGKVHPVDSCRWH